MKSYFSRITLGLAVAVGACALYWGQLLESHRHQQVYAEDQIQFRATRLADALAIQVNTLFSGLEYLVTSLAATYLVDNRDFFALSVQTALSTFPRDSLVQISVADAHGSVVYNRVYDSPLPASQLRDEAPISIFDREHFRIHADKPDSQVYVSRPVFGRLSQRWTIQMSYPLRKNGQFLGVVVLSVSPDYVSDYFRELFTNEGDAAALLYTDGTYMARSSHEDYAMDNKVAPDRPFLLDKVTQSGRYRAAPVFDPVERFYAWHRVADYPLIVTIGLERGAGLAELRKIQETSVFRSVLGTLLFLAFVFWITWLFVRLKQDQSLLAESEQRFKLALQGGKLGAWEWDARRRHFSFDEAWAAMLGYGPGELSGSTHVYLELVHPDERALIKSQMDKHFSGETAMFESEHRMRHKDGRWIWVSARGGITSRSDSGEPMRVAGIQADITAQKEDELLRQALFDNSAAEVLLMHPDDRVVMSSNQRANQTFSPTGDSLVGLSAATFHTSEENAARFVSIYNELRARGDVQLEAPMRNGKGEERWFSMNGTLFDRNAPDGAVIWTCLDITQRRQMEQSLADAWLRLTQVIEHFPGGVLVEDEDGTILIVNQMFCNLLYLGKEAATLMGTPTAALPDSLGPEDAAHLRAVLPLAEQTDTEQMSQELSYRDTVLHVSVTTVRRGQASRGRLWVVDDITARIKHESDLNRLATTDALTGLPNRPAFLSRLDAELAMTSQEERQGILMMADLDLFKHVNDTYGHAAGDEVLRFLAGVFHSTLRQTDMAGRLGGEEFSILLPGADDETAWRVAERIRAQLAQSDIPTAAGVVHITLSIGMARLSVGDATEILASADAALYRAKRSGRNRVEAAWEDAAAV